MSQMKKVQVSGAQNRKKKARYEEQFRQRGSLDTWISRNKEQVVEHEEVNDDHHDHDDGAGSASEGLSAAQSEHNTVSPPRSPDESSFVRMMIHVRKWKIKEILAHF